MRIVFLDQNHWVSLARAAREPEAYPAEYDVLTRLGRAVEAGETIVPLSATHLHETYKIGDPRRRHDMAYTQATLSGGQVLCCRAALLHAQVTDVLRDAHGLPPIQRPERWFLSNVFIEASVELDHPSLDGKPSPKLLAAMRRHPAEFLYDYLMSADETTRLTAVSMFSAGIAELRQRIEDRRDRWREQSLAIRRRAYGATLIIDDMDRLVQIARKAGVEIAQVTDLGPALCKRLVRDVPLYNVERELSVRLEAQDRPLQENDFRDMQAYCAAVTYADAVVGENLFVNLARQARLDETYKTLLATRLDDPAWLSTLANSPVGSTGSPTNGPSQRKR
ncbi:MAG: hypothetical protein BGN86_10005 [Caulobacterales bacterium 68-7]|nr:MAG: hypothetical protein BGN86_10005 [Caulobacterales bacterium 68-7]